MSGAARKPRIGKEGAGPLQRLRDLPEGEQEKLFLRAREVSAKTLIAEIRAQYGIAGLTEQRLSDFWRWLASRDALRRMQADAEQFRAEFAREGASASPEEIHIATVDYLRLKGLREDDNKLLAYALTEARKAIELEHGGRRLALLETNAARAKEQLEGIKSKGGLTAETLRQIEEAAKLL